MKLKFKIALIALVGFVCGWMSACIVLQKQFSKRRADLQEQSCNNVNQWRDKVRSLQGEIFGKGYFNRDDAMPKMQSMLESFVPDNKSQYIKLAYVGGLGGNDLHLNLYGDGSLYTEFRGVTQLVTVLPRDNCKNFFFQFLTSGILNYSEDIVFMKMNLLPPDNLSRRTDKPNTELHISIPELQIKKTISVYGLNNQLENFPDIIELQLVTQFEKKVLGLVPKDYPLPGVTH